MVSGSATDTGCAAGVRGTLVEVFQPAGKGKARFVTATRHAQQAAAARGGIAIAAKGTAAWRSIAKAKLPAGRYRVRVSTFDKTGNLKTAAGDARSRSSSRPRRGRGPGRAPARNSARGIPSAGAGSDTVRAVESPTYAGMFAGRVAPERRVTGRLGIVLSLVGLCCGALPAAAGAQGRVEPVAGLVDEADSIVAGPDGAMWASVAADPGRIARITTAGAVSLRGRRRVRGLSGQPAPVGPGEPRRRAVVRAVAAGRRRSRGCGSATRSPTFSLAHGRPTSLAGGPDGALWMTVDGGPGQPDAITRFTADPPARAVATRLPATSDPRSIVAGPDGALWFVEGGRIGRITTTGALTYRPWAPRPPRSPPARSGSLWYAQGSTVRRLDDPPTYATGSPVDGAGRRPRRRAVGGRAGRRRADRRPARRRRRHRGIDPAARGRAIAAGPDGRMWMTLDRAPYLVKITVPPRVDDASPPRPTVGCPPPSTRTASRPRARAELRQPDGTWRAVAETEVYGTAVRDDGPAAAPRAGAGRARRARDRDQLRGQRVVAPDHGPAARRARAHRRPRSRPRRPTRTGDADPDAGVGPRRGQERRGGGAERHGELPRPAGDDATPSSRARRRSRSACCSTPPPARSASPRRWTAQTQAGTFHGGKFSVTQTPPA